MRLIDADELEYEDIECVNGNTYMVVNAADIDNAPTVNVVSRIHAKVLIKTNSRDKHDSYSYCSNCEEILPTYYDNLNFCPNCGAKLEREDKE